MKCPTCRKPAVVTKDNPFRPFCSERCKLIDLGRWASGTYRMPGENISPETEDSIEHLNGPEPDEPN